MANDNGLIDEYENLEKQRKEIEVKEEELKRKIIELAKEKNTGILFGNNKKCFIKEYEKVVYPEDKTNIIELMKQKGIYDNYSMLNYMKLNSSIIKGNVEQDIIALIKKEKAFRLSLRDI